MRTFVPIPEQQIQAAKRVNLIALAEQHTPLQRASGVEYAGPCPKCGGDDRFHCTAEWFFCRHCHPKRGDTIEFMRWQMGLKFDEAVSQLMSGVTSMPAGSCYQQPLGRQAVAKPRPARWGEQAARIVDAAHERLWLPSGEPAQAYLLGRGLEPHTWMQFGMGYRPDAPLPGTRGQQHAPALVLPWYVSGKLVGVRYRFLEVQHYTDADGKERSEKLVAETGSQFAGRFFGGQALPDWLFMPNPDGYSGAQALCTLLIVEGEINAMSIWQVAGETRLHVLSLGSESQTLTPAAVKFARGYGHVFVWADREEIAQQLMAALPGAAGIQSPGGKDANDLLQAGLLGGFLATIRANHAKYDGLEALFWALYDTAALPLGIDAGTTGVLQRLATGLGKEATLFEAEPRRWLTVH